MAAERDSLTDGFAAGLLCTCVYVCAHMSQFFISPLMLEGSLEREVLAVDSEFSGVMQSDSCRASQLMCHTVGVT